MDPEYQHRQESSDQSQSIIYYYYHGELNPSLSQTSIITRRFLAKSKVAHVGGTAGVERVYNQRSTRGEFYIMLFVAMEEKLIYLDLAACPIPRGQADV